MAVNSITRDKNRPWERDPVEEADGTWAALTINEMPYLLEERKAPCFCNRHTFQKHKKIESNYHDKA